MEPETITGRPAREWRRWGLRHYPGILRGIFETLGARWAVNSIQSWRKGHRNPSKEAVLAVFVAMNSRLSAGQAIADRLKVQLDAWPERQPSGFCLVKERDGVIRDGRGKGGRPKTGI